MVTRLAIALAQRVQAHHSNNFFVVNSEKSWLPEGLCQKSASFGKKTLPIGPLLAAIFLSKATGFLAITNQQIVVG